MAAVLYVLPLVYYVTHLNVHLGYWKILVGVVAVARAYNCICKQKLRFVHLSGLCFLAWPLAFMGGWCRLCL